MAHSPASPDAAAEDAALMRRVQASDAGAFAALMERWERPVKAVIARLILNAAEAEDLAQDTFVNVWQHRDRYDSSRAVKPWILGIAVNLARNRLRWWRRRPAVSLEAWTEAPSAPDEAACAGALTLEQHERAQAVRDAIARLPHDFREALVLCEYEQLSYREIAAMLQVSEKTVENRVLRARAKLRPDLQAWRTRPA